MCSLCSGKKVIRQESGGMVAFHACPNCRVEKQDLTDIIEQLEAKIAAWQQREKSA